jgi:hypothetical protein
MSDQDKAFVLNSLRTSEQVPEITSEEQYELYSKLEHELSAQLPGRDDPTYGKAFQRAVEAQKQRSCNTKGLENVGHGKKGMVRSPL